jgi:hypothetical protein
LTCFLTVGLIPIFSEAIKWGFTALMVFMLGIIFQYTKNRANNKYLLWIGSLLCVFILSCAWAISFKLVLWVILKQLLPIFIVTISISVYIHKISDIYDILKVFYISSLLMVSYIITHVDETLQGEGFRLGRMMVLDDNVTWNSNVIAIVLVFAVYCGFFILWKYSGKRKSFVRILYIVLSLGMIYLILLCGSRKGILMLIIPILCFNFYNLKQKFLKKVIGIIITLGISYVLIMKVPFFYNIIGSRLEDMVNIVMNKTEGTEDTSRLLLIPYGWEWFKEHPIIGVGINNFRTLSNNTYLFADKNFYAHNNYIELLVGVGLIGFFIYYIGYFYVIRATLKKSTIVNKWIVSLFIVLLFVDFAAVSYYDLVFQLFICIGFSAIQLEKTKNYIKCD